MRIAGAGWAGGLLVLAACDDATVIRVHPATGFPASRIELFLAQDEVACDDGPCRIQLDDQPRAIDARIFLRDQEQRLFEDVEPGEDALFRLEPGEVSATIARFVAVGYDAHAVATSARYVESPTDTTGAHELTVDLEYSDADLDFPSSGMDGQFLRVWPQAGGPSACLAYQKGYFKADVIVPADDRDCDGVPDRGEHPQCEYNAGGPRPDPRLPPEDATCVAAPTDVPGACALGTRPECVNDATGGVPACEGGALCIPTEHCDTMRPCAVTDDPTPAQLLGCVAAPPVNLTHDLAISCRVPVVFKTPATDRTRYRICKDVDLPTPLPGFATTSMGCQDARLDRVDGVTGVLDEGSSIMFGARDVPGPRQATVEVELPHDMGRVCDPVLHFAGIELTGPDLSSFPADPMLVRLSPVRGDHAIAIPLEITFERRDEDTCGDSGAECRFVGESSDPMFRCVP